MESPSYQDLKCNHCNINFSRKFNFIQHLKKKHDEEFLSPENSRKSNIICIICSKEKVIGAFSTYQKYMEHLEQYHQINVKRCNATFDTKEEFEAWRHCNNRDVDYSYESNCVQKTCKILYYNCNRSDTKGLVQKKINSIKKSGGSIKMNGTCPSRIIACFTENGPVTVKYFETHVGHNIEVRTQRLSSADQDYLLTQLLDGVCVDRIVKNARNSKPNSSEPSKLNLITKNDLCNLARRKNVEKYRHSSDMIATAMKVKEWNSDGKNYAFLFKQIGESHPQLRNEDFAIAYMNNTMEQKLKEFGRIVCIDGTHGLTRYKGWELTTLLVKDDTNAGFPVAFMLSNRKDQVMQEVFLSALRVKLGECIIQTEFLMSDDDIKYYNAWRNTMNSTPRRLLCSWHIIRNWNIQGKKKIKNKELQSSMKRDMKKIMSATTEDKFCQYRDDYFKLLSAKNETEFIEYLQKYYFSDKDRIMSWAYCHRSVVGINTNMALESLNRFIKKEKLKGNGNIRLEKLLNTLEEVVDDKMWNRIISIKRPHRNTYQGRVVMKAHKKAEQLLQSVEITQNGEFIVKSLRQQIHYKVVFKQPCDSNCRVMFCQLCDICFHKFTCECVEYLIKNTTCKHVHAVALFLRKYQGTDPEDSFGQTEKLPVSVYNAEISNFLTERNIESQEVLEEQEKDFIIQHASNYLSQMFNLDNHSFKVFAKNFQSFVNKNNKDLNICSKKRKFTKQTYFPDAKKRKSEI